MKRIAVVLFGLALLVYTSNAQTALIDHGDGTVTDTGTGSMWQKATAPGTYTWQQALAEETGQTQRNVRGKNRLSPGR